MESFVHIGPAPIDGIDHPDPEEEAKGSKAQVEEVKCDHVWRTTGMVISTHKAFCNRGKLCWGNAGGVVVVGGGGGGRKTVGAIIIARTALE